MTTDITRAEMPRAQSPMDLLRAWRPVALSRQLRKKPIEIKLFGQEIVLFRDATGRVGALANRCPHRRMRLGLGRVEGSEIVCPYHGWRFTADGTGRTPGTRGMKASTRCYETAERNGAIWLRADGEAKDLPNLSFQGYDSIVTLHHKMDAPLYLLLDNMMELEHTASVHSVFGFDTSRLHEVKTSMEKRADGVYIYYEGAQRKLPFYLALLLGVGPGIHSGDRFVQHADVHFSPVHAVYDLEWHNPRNDALRGMQLKFVIYFNEIDKGRAEQFTFAYFKGGSALSHALLAATRPVLAANINRELLADIHLVESLKLPEDEDQRFGFDRFDQPLRARRQMTTPVEYPPGSAAEPPRNGGTVRWI